MLHDWHRIFAEHSAVVVVAPRGIFASNPADRMLELRQNPRPVGLALQRIANELLLKLGLRGSPRAMRTYLPKLPVGAGFEEAQRCKTFGASARRLLSAVSTSFNGRRLARSSSAWTCC